MDKSALKRAYKEAKRPMGVYSIRTTNSDKVYIGYGAEVEAKINRHKTELKFGSHRNKELQQIWKLHGEAAFTFEILDTLDHEEDSTKNPTEELKLLTEMWIQKLEKEGNAVAYL